MVDPASVLNTSTAERCHQEPQPLVFPDVLGNKVDHDDDPSAAFFDLANASYIAYRLSKNVPVNCQRSETELSSDKSKETKRQRLDTSTSTKSQTSNSSDMIIIHQDVSACLQHTGGIVWETCYLLLTYLSHQMKQNNERLGDILELGAGCGLLGQGLAVAAAAASNSSTRQVVLTEHPEAFDNLQANVLRNHDILCRRAPSVAVDCCVLDWQHVDRDMTTNAHLLRDVPFDTLVGTDVLFSPRLVHPLLQTMKALSHSQTTVYLCVQIRCAEAHGILLRDCGEYGFSVTDISEQVYQVNGCDWGRELECLVLRLTRITP
jgi:predicted nicotinamide N-methyase